MAVSAILLRRGALTVGIAPEAGGSISRLDLRSGGRCFDILRRAAVGPVRIAPALNMSSFPLVPYCGRLRDGRFEFAGRSIAYPLNALPEPNSSHGDGFTREWHLTELERDRAVMRIAPRADAPIQFECTQTVRVEPDRVSIELRACNLEEQPIPLEMGFHPYFADRNGARITASLPLRTHWDAQLMPTFTAANDLQCAFASGLAATELPWAAEYGGWNGQALIEWPASHIAVELRTRPALAHAVVWAPVGEKFFCFEPLSHPTDSFNRHSRDPEVAPPRRLLPGECTVQELSFSVRTDNAGRTDR
ncbi:MAG: hypothetical protein JSR66_23100 [Proteobacteria bacterium]|nr:hypothetical protein [Pseudomonadota bacterium]